MPEAKPSSETTTKPSSSSSSTEDGPSGPLNEKLLHDSPKESWKEETKENWIGLKMAYDGMVLDGINRRGRLVERLVKKTQDGTIGQPGPDKPQEADMGVRVGSDDVTHNHYEVAAPAAPDSRRAPPEGTEPIEGFKWESAVKPLIALATAAGLGFGAANLINSLSSKDSPEFVDTDTNTIQQLELVEDGDPES